VVPTDAQTSLIGKITTALQADAVPTDAQTSLIGKITTALQADARIGSAWLVGSLGRGNGDAFSDVDVMVVVPDDAFDTVFKAYAANLSAIAPTVLINPLFGRVLNVVTDDWSRFDLTLMRPAEFAARAPAWAKPLFNRGDDKPPPAAPAPVDYRPAPQRILSLTQEFLRVLGLLPVAMGREEYVNCQLGVGHLRGMLIDMMIEQNCIAPEDRGGALHVNRLLTDAQRRVLEALPAIGPTRDSALDAHVAYARLFLPLARDMCAATGADWPRAFADATRKHLDRTLGLGAAAFGP
jgi:predicted nucleotidyltransferase